MVHLTRKWYGPILLLEFRSRRAGHAGGGHGSPIPAQPGVYVFTEYASGPLRPNPPSMSPTDPGYAHFLETFRKTPCVLYVGMSVRLDTRVASYLFTPYLEIERRPKGTPPRHQAPRHKAKALLHAHLYFGGQVYVRWTLTADATEAQWLESRLIKELQPALNTLGL
jgi:hypothetical protein